MQTKFQLNLRAVEQRVVATVIAQNEITADFGELLDAAFANLAVITDAQGFSSKGEDAALAVTVMGGGDALRTKRYELQCRNLHPSVWRVLDGLIHTFDVASMALDVVRLEGVGRVVADKEVLELAYPGARADHGLQLQREQGAGMDRSVEVELVAGIAPDSRRAIKSGLAAWLALCEGGFFADGEDPVTSAHDCPGFVEVGSLLLVARFEYFLSTEAAFDVLVNALAHWQGRWGATASVRIY